MRIKNFYIFNSILNGMFLFAEVIRRDSELTMLRAVMAGAEREAAEQRRERQLRAIDGDRAFLRRVNIGVEAMSDEDQRRVRRIAKAYRWINAEGVDADFLSDDEVENFTIRSGTLTPNKSAGEERASAQRGIAGAPAIERGRSRVDGRAYTASRSLRLRSIGLCSLR